MTDGNGARPIHTPDEMCAIIDALSKDEVDRLTLYAVRLANTLGGVDARDLLHEAFVASTVGDRRCPKDVSPVAFLGNVMKSNLSNERRKSKRTESATGKEDELDTVAGDNPELWIEQMDALKSIIEEMKKAFGDDDRPLLVLEGRAEGMSREEIRQLVELEPVQFESLEKKIRRFMNKRLSDRRAE